ncbi:glycosyltransferase [Bradyrhizobium sp. BRP22]|uniref:glycosyltransferase n=1 Tax=Bradyrhizobium sp. BRP22 TaxID=2793821 RepID=UPI001CD3652A|nr:glycosyltransferase [Bradyrhizobium sp. BRP22]MCA1451764.1 glycosyltransferase [Bradyrhizobium sp. BRP22]
MKTFGIYLCYPPKVDLRGQGLGRYLAEFLKEAKVRADVRFVIACPSWMRDSLKEWSRSVGLQPDAFEVIGPEKVPTLLRFYEAYQTYRAYRLRKKKVRDYMSKVRSVCGSLVAYVARTAATTRSTVALAFIGLIASPVLLIYYAVRLINRSVPSRRIYRALVRRYRSQFAPNMGRLVARPQDNGFTLRLYRYMETAEAKLLSVEIEKRKEISAWFAPTAFWPHFNDIKAPRLICVPDVVLADFPVAFSAVNEERFHETFRLVEQAIKGGSHFVTYSLDVKQRTLVERYGVPPEAIDVILHGANRLDDLIRISGLSNENDATNAFCANLFATALQKAVRTSDPSRFANNGIQFIFYASQFRPNKNVLTLLRAYNHLLKQRYLPHKLILTGHPDALPEIARFIQKQNLNNDVLCLHGLSDQELAACYRLAALAVNPSLSEGGCPFTFTEALSVDTPVVMARIAVTEEVISDPELRDLMLFDPYSWKDMAGKIEWALCNRADLLQKQRALYGQLTKRSWSNVVDEYITLLDRISSDRVDYIPESVSKPTAVSKPAA